MLGVDAVSNVASSLLLILNGFIYHFRLGKNNVALTEHTYVESYTQGIIIRFVLSVFLRDAV